MNWFRNECERRRESLCLLASGALPEPEARALESHLAECAGCRQYFAEVKSVAAPLAGWEGNFANVEPDPAAQRRWARAIEAAPSNQAAIGPKKQRFALAPSPPRSGGEGWGEEATSDRTAGQPLSPTLSPLLRHGAREIMAKVWFELIWPARRIWAGLAAVWVALAVFNFAQAGGGETALAKSTVPDAEVRLAFQEQQQLLAEILGPPLAAAPPETPPRSPLNRPRSERRDGFVMT